MTSSPRIDKRQSLERMLLQLKARSMRPGISYNGEAWRADVEVTQRPHFGRTPSAALRKAIRAWEKEQE